MWNNCLFWALRQWQWGRNGVLIIRKSHWGPFPHFLWARKAPDDCLSFVPLNPKPRWIPPPWFRGRVQQGDDGKEE